MRTRKKSEATAEPGGGQLLLGLDHLSTDSGIQQRAKFSRAVVAEYAAAMAEGASFPPVVAFHDGENYWVADGHYRLGAYRKIGAREVAVEVRPGSKRDAILYACGANDTHGTRRTNADKRRAVTTMLQDPEWKLLDAREIARRCAVDEKTVRNVRTRLQNADNPQYAIPREPEEPWGRGEARHAAIMLSRAIEKHWASYRSKDIEPLVDTLTMWLRRIQEESDARRGEHGRNGTGDPADPGGGGDAGVPGRTKPDLEEVPGRAD